MGYFQENLGVFYTDTGDFKKSDEEAKQTLLEALRKLPTFMEVDPGLSIGSVTPGKGNEYVITIRRRP